MNRRKFIGQSAIGMGAMLALPDFLKAEASAGYKYPVGFQTYPIRDLVSKDFAGTMKLMAGLGYQYTEMCYPAGYANAGFGPLVNIKPADLRQMITDAGLYCPSCHFGIGDLTNNLDKCIEFALALGMTQMVTPGFDVPENTIAGYKTAAEKFNKIAEKIKSAGMATGYHNHQKEFVLLDGELIYDAIISALDGGLVKMQFQTEVITLGYKASTYFEKYPGRFISAHLSDWTADKKQVPVGKGVIDWAAFFAAAKTGGLKNFFVEMNFDNYKDSAAYIHQLVG
jgi:sugar phosphate isomerase/epimerase